MKRILTLVAVFAFVLGVGNVAFCYPVMNQTGNLISNGNFETGQISPWLINDGSTVSATTNLSIDGQYSAQIDTRTGIIDNHGTYVIGLWQYPSEISGVFTASAWVYPMEGQAHIGIAWNSGSGSAYVNYSAPTNSLNTWQYLEVTATGTFGLGGVLLYGLSDHDLFLVDGVWLNSGAANLSPYAAVPLPSAALLFGSGLVMVGSKIARDRRRRVKSNFVHTPPPI